jgi:RND family efflux transporter MFP subunit
MTTDGVVRLGIIGSLVVDVAAATACSQAPKAAEPERAAVAVRTARVESVELISAVEAGGVVRARTTALVASRVLAPILNVHARPGDRVRRGAVLVTLDAREALAAQARATAASLSAAEAVAAADADVRASVAALQLARVTHDRTNALLAKRSATQQELDQAVATLAASDAQAAAARARLTSARAGSDAARAAAEGARIGASYMTLIAPFDGLVTERHADPGSMAVPGAALLTLEDTSAFRLEVQVDEARAASVAPGQAVAVRFDHAASADWIDARVVEVGRVDATSHAFVVKIDVPESAAAQSGVFGRARFGGPARRTVAVPATAVIARGQLSFVYAVSDGRAHLRPISVGARPGDRVEVLAGLHEGDVVVLEPGQALGDGAPVSGAGR